MEKHEEDEEFDKLDHILEQSGCLKELEESNDEDDEYSDGPDQESVESKRQISEQVDGMAEYQQNMALSSISYKHFMKTLKNLNASLNYS